MINGETSSGFKFEINEQIFSDWRFVKKIKVLKKLDVQDESYDGDFEVDFVETVSDLECLLFADKGKAFEKHIEKNNDGMVPTTVVLEELFEILNSNEESKK